MAKSKAPALRPGTGIKSGAYFLSLTVENLRCFGPAQTLDLSDGHGGHAPWTIILGENGLGKTTLLTCLASIASAGYTLGGQGYPTSDVQRLYLGEWIGGLRDLLRGPGSDSGGFEAVIVFCNGSRRVVKIETTIVGRGPISTRWPTGLTERLPTFHYGASRRMPQGKSLSDRDDRVSIFLDDDVALRAPEDWLLRPITMYVSVVPMQSALRLLQSACRMR